MRCALRVLLIALYLPLLCGCWTIKPPTTTPPPAAELVPTQIKCDGDAMELCDRMPERDRAACDSAIGGQPVELAICTVCADRHRRLVTCFREHNAKAAKAMQSLSKRLQPKGKP